MTNSVRLVNTFVLRVWREPGDSEDDNGWRGTVRPLTGKANASDPQVPFYGLEQLLAALRPLLDQQD